MSTIWGRLHVCCFTIPFYLMVILFEYLNFQGRKEKFRILVFNDLFDDSGWFYEGIRDKIGWVASNNEGNM